ncbi:hypothetical protein ABTZ59_36730 [Streptomyces sp. NPDC094034]|uniref:hypothetical protein n=1 Tax=Streptomyces sp. NPDC094034 TaxID=3155309 RepID=UPI003321577A
MNVRLRTDEAPAIPAMGACFMCQRDYLAVVAIGDLTRNGGPGHEAIEIPLYACRACEGRLRLLLSDALRSPGRPYVLAGHPH